MAGEEPPQRADTEAMSLLGKPRLQLGKRDAVTLVDQREDLFALCHDPRREPVPSARLRSRTASLSVASAPADRARHAHAEPLHRLASRHPAGNRCYDAFAKIQGQAASHRCRPPIRQTA
jgi:hypothetical protein